MTTDDLASRTYVLVADHDGSTVYTGPVDLGTALLITDQYAVPNGWTTDVIPLMDQPAALRVLTAGRRPEDEEPLAANVYVALRRAIVTDPQFDGAECPRGRHLVLHVERHRPVQLWTGPEDCMLGDCEHGSDSCPDVKPAELLCRVCSAVYDTNSEYGMDWLEPGRVSWPCRPLQVVVDHYQLGKELAAVTT